MGRAIGGPRPLGLLPSDGGGPAEERGQVLDVGVQVLLGLPMLISRQHLRGRSDLPGGDAASSSLPDDQGGPGHYAVDNFFVLSNAGRKQTSTRPA
jgi:hypothetical protein